MAKKKNGKTNGHSNGNGQSEFSKRNGGPWPIERVYSDAAGPHLRTAQPECCAIAGALLLGLRNRRRGEFAAAGGAAGRRDEWGGEPRAQLVGRGRDGGAQDERGVSGVVVGP